MNCEQIQHFLLQSLEEPESLTLLQERLLEDHLPYCKDCTEQEEAFLNLQLQLKACFSPFTFQENQAQEAQLFERLEPLFVERQQQYQQWLLSFQHFKRFAIAALVLFLSYSGWCFFSSSPIENTSLVHVAPVPFVAERSRLSTETTLKEVVHFPLHSEETLSEKLSTELVAKQKFPEPIYGNESTIIDRLKPFPRKKIFWETKRLRGEVLELSESREWITLNKGEKDYLFEGMELVLHQKNFQLVTRVSYSGESQSICKVEAQKYPIEKGCFFFSTIRVPKEKFVKNVYVQGKIALLEEKQVVIDPLIHAEDLEIGDLLSVYRGSQKIGIIFIAEAPKFQTGHIIYQSQPFQRGDVVLLEEQPKHFLSASF